MRNITGDDSVRHTTRGRRKEQVEKENVPLLFKGRNNKTNQKKLG